MAMAALWISLLVGGTEVANNAIVVVQSLKAVHHHTTRAVYRHVIKPIGKVVKK